MEITILEQKANPVLNREEITFEVDHPGEQTPNREAVASKLAAIVNADRSRTVVKKLETHYGKNKTFGYANLYSTDENALQTEPKYILIRNGLVESDK